jgi:hypothetical protein
MARFREYIQTRSVLAQLISMRCKSIIDMARKRVADSSCMSETQRASCNTALSLIYENIKSIKVIGLSSFEVGVTTKRTTFLVSLGVRDEHELQVPWVPSDFHEYGDNEERRLWWKRELGLRSILCEIPILFDGREHCAPARKLLVLLLRDYTHYELCERDARYRLLNGSDYFWSYYVEWADSTCSGVLADGDNRGCITT